MARAYIELPSGWGPGRIIIAACERAGFECEERRLVATGERILILHAPRDQRPNRQPM